MKNNTENVILYIINKLGEKIEGRKKLMKLMFLVEHFDVKKHGLVKTKLMGNDFLIYYYGVFSFDVKKAYDSLVSKNKIKDKFPIELKQKGQIKLNEDFGGRIDDIISDFGEMSGYELEIKTLDMLGIKPFEKGKFFGKSVKEIIN